MAGHGLKAKALQCEALELLQPSLEIRQTVMIVVMGPGMAAGFPAGSGDGHHLINRTDKDAVYLEVGGRDGPDDLDYPDIDMIRRTRGGTKVFLHKDETPYD